MQAEDSRGGAVPPRCPGLALGFFAGGDVGGELGGLAAGDAEGLPLAGFGSGHVFCGEDDLADVHGIVRDLAIDGLHDGVRFVADHHFAADVALHESFKRVENIFPTGTPHGHQLFAGFRCVFEFGVAIAIRFLAVGRHEIAPARAHVANHMLDDDGDGVGLGIECGEKIFVGALLHGALGEFFILAEESERVLNVGRRKLVWHRRILNAVKGCAQEYEDESAMKTVTGLSN
jgi:hypothetical protein